MGGDATMSEAKTASGVSLDIVKVSALLFVRVNFDVYQNSISFLLHVIYLTDTSFPPTLIPPKTHRFWKSLIVSKDYDTEIIDGTVSTARAGFEDCTKLRKISVTKRTWDQAEETKNKNTSSRRNRWGERTVLFLFKIHRESCWYRWFKVNVAGRWRTN